MNRILFVATTHGFILPQAEDLLLPDHSSMSRVQDLSHVTRVTCPDLDQWNVVCFVTTQQ